MDRAIILARTSLEDTTEEKRNLNSQVQNCRKYCSTHQYQIRDEFMEEVSGVELKTPALEKIRKLAHQNQFDVLVLRELDRLSRSLVKQLLVEEELRTSGVRVEYVLEQYDDTPEGRLQKHIRATVAEYEREKIKQRMYRGLCNVLRSGKALLHNKPPYGYSYNTDTRHFEVEPQEANVVQDIFEWYLGGDSAREVAKRLTTRGVPTWRQLRDTKHWSSEQRPHSGVWGGSTVIYMLGNESYKGSRQYGTSDLYVPYPPIVSEAVWDAAQARRAESKKRAVAWITKKRSWLLSRRATCGDCGYKMQVTGRPKYKYYKCPSSHRRYYRACSARQFRAEVVDKKVWKHLANLISSERDYNALIEAYMVDVKPMIQQVVSLDKLITENKQMLEKVTHSFSLLDVEDQRSRALLHSQMKEIEGMLDGFEQEKVNIEEDLKNRIDPDAIASTMEACRRKLADEVDRASDNFDLQRKVVKLLDVQAVLHDQGKRVVELSFNIYPDVCLFLTNKPYNSVRELRATTSLLLE